MEREILRGLFKEMNKVRNVMEKYRYAYPRGSHFFPSSVPEQTESKEELMRYFREEIQRLGIVSMKLSNWFEEFLDYDFQNVIIDVPKGDALNESVSYFSIPELHLIYQPINAETNTVYSVRAVRDWFAKNSSRLNVVVNVPVKKYSRFDFEKFLSEAGIHYNKDLTASLLDFVNSDKGRRQSRVERSRSLYQLIRDYSR